MEGQVYTILIAVIVLLLGILIGKIIGKLFSKLLKKTGIDYFVSDKFRVSHIISTLIEWSVYVMFLQVFFEMLEIMVISDMLGMVVGYLPNLIEAVIVLTVALVIIQFLKGYMHNVTLEHKDHFINIMTFFIVYVAVAIAMAMLGIDTFLIDTSLLIIATGLAIIIVVSLGMGFREYMVEHTKWIKSYVKGWKKDGSRNNSNNQ